PDVRSETVDPIGTAPGCQVPVARPSAETTAPARVACATAEPVTAGGMGAALTADVVGAGAEVEPPLPVAVTTSEIVEPISPGESVYDDPVAPGMAVHCAPSGSQRPHWYANEDGAPVQVRTEAVRVCPACAVPVTVGVDVATGRVTELPPATTATVAGELATAAPAGACAVTPSARAWPTSLVTGM